MSSSPLVLVTGSTDGIGKETAAALASLGARVIVHGRSPERTRAAAEQVRTRAPGAWVGEVSGDLSVRADVRAIADAVLRTHGTLDVLINNAGVFMQRRAVTPDGMESTLAVNLLAPVLLTHLLLPALTASGAGRVINVSSVAHLRGRIDWNDWQGELDFDGYQAYAQSKLALVLFTVELARRLAGQPVVANSLHPGVVTTKLLQDGFGITGPDSLTESAATSVYLALAPEGAQVSGKYFVSRRQSRMHPLAGDPATTARVYATACATVGVPLLQRPATGASAGR